MWPDADPVRSRDVTAAAILAAPWAVALAVVALALPPTGAQAGCADPLMVTAHLAAHVAIPALFD